MNGLEWHWWGRIHNTWLVSLEGDIKDDTHISGLDNWEEREPDPYNSEHMTVYMNADSGIIENGTVRDGGVYNERRWSMEEFMVDPASTLGGEGFLVFRQRGWWPDCWHRSACSSYPHPFLLQGSSPCLLPARVCSGGRWVAAFFSASWPGSSCPRICVFQSSGVLGRFLEVHPAIPAGTLEAIQGNHPGWYFTSRHDSMVRIAFLNHFSSSSRYSFHPSSFFF